MKIDHPARIAITSIIFSLNDGPNCLHCMSHKGVAEKINHALNSRLMGLLSEIEFDRLGKLLAIRDKETFFIRDRSKDDIEEELKKHSEYFENEAFFYCREIKLHRLNNCISFTDLQEILDLV